jgi:hypothetical protein
MTIFAMAADDSNRQPRVAAGRKFVFSAAHSTSFLSQETMLLTMAKLF